MSECPAWIFLFGSQTRGLVAGVAGVAGSVEMSSRRLPGGLTGEGS